jgi:hypothetical protein
MSERGVFAVDRGVFDHPMFAPEPFTEREAWLWMVGAAAWKPGRVRVGRHPVDLLRGQLAFATRFMATRWRWSEARVRRFLKRLQSDAMVSIQTTRETTHITICNYDKYSFGRRTDVPEIDAPNVTTATHPRRKEEEGKELKKEEEKKTVFRAVVPTRPSDETDFQEFKKAYPKRQGANPWAPARKSFLSAIKRGATAETMIAALNAGVGYDPEKIGTVYIPRATTWLSEERWKEFDTTGPPSRGGWQPGMPTDEELRAKYSKGKADGKATAGSERPDMGEASPMVRDCIRTREGNGGVVHRPGGDGGARSLASILQKNGLGSLGLSQHGTGTTGVDSAVSVAGMDEIRAPEEDPKAAI